MFKFIVALLFAQVSLSLPWTTTMDCLNTTDCKGPGPVIEINDAPTKPVHVNSEIPKDIETPNPPLPKVNNDDGVRK